MQPQPGHAQVGGHGPVQRPLAVGGITHQRVRQGLEVAADLVAPAAQRLHRHQRQAGVGMGRVGVDRQRQALQHLPAGAGGQQRLAGGRQLGVTRQRGAGLAGVGRPAAHPCAR
jgi:hypothetical protein